MKLPEKVKIGIHSYKVKYPYIFDSNTLVGQCCIETGEIKVKRVTQAGEVQSQENRLICFFHEILHAVDNTYCMSMIGMECNKENLIDALSEGIVQVLKENPELLEVFK